MQATTLNEVIKIVEGLSVTDQHSLFENLRERLEAENNDEWKLEAEQLAFMIQNHEAIESAYQNDDMAFLTALESSKAYQAVFGDMPWDEAYDRYEESWWVDDEDTA